MSNGDPRMERAGLSHSYTKAEPSKTCSRNSLSQRTIVGGCEKAKAPCGGMIHFLIVSRPFTYATYPIQPYHVKARLTIRHLVICIGPPWSFACMIPFPLVSTRHALLSAEALKLSLFFLPSSALLTSLGLVSFIISRPGRSVGFAVMCLAAVLLTSERGDAYPGSTFAVFRHRDIGVWK